MLICHMTDLFRFIWNISTHVIQFIRLHVWVIFRGNVFILTQFFVLIHD